MKLGKLLKSIEAEGKEKHVPSIEVDKSAKKDGDIVQVIVGKEVPHPNTIEHHIGWIELFGLKKDGQVICLGRASFAPSFTAPKVEFKVLAEEFQVFCALAYCNIHGIWENCIEM